LGLAADMEIWIKMSDIELLPCFTYIKYKEETSMNFKFERIFLMSRQKSSVGNQ
jgi:hypothetical protein